MKYLRKLKIELVKGEYKNPVKGQVREPKQVYDVFKAIKDRAQETLIGVYLDTDLEVKTYDTLSVGSQTETLVDEADIFGRAFIFRAHYLIFIHNHPQGDPHPSEHDRMAMQQLIKQAKIMKLSLLDFIIVGDDRYWSMFEELDGGSYLLGSIHG